MRLGKLCPRVSQNRNFSHVRHTNTGHFRSSGMVGRLGTGSVSESPDGYGNVKGKQVPESIVYDSVIYCFTGD